MTGTWPEPARTIGARPERDWITGARPGLNRTTGSRPDHDRITGAREVPVVVGRRRADPPVGTVSRGVPGICRVMVGSREGRP